MLAIIPVIHYAGSVFENGLSASDSASTQSGTVALLHLTLVASPRSSHWPQPFPADFPWALEPHAGTQRDRLAGLKAGQANGDRRVQQCAWLVHLDGVRAVGLLTSLSSGNTSRSRSLICRMKSSRVRRARRMPPMEGMWRTKVQFSWLSYPHPRLLTAGAIRCTIPNTRQTTL